MREQFGYLHNTGEHAFMGGIARIEQAKRKTLRIEGGRPLTGTIEEVRGGKNMLSPLLLAACLADSPSIIRNVPDISELTAARSLLNSINAAEVIFLPHKASIELTPNPPNNFVIPTELGEPSRSSIVAAGFLLAKYGEADIPLPGGDKLGERSIATHVEGLQDLGAQVDDSFPGRLRFSAEHGLKGGKVRLRFPRITATETLILAATKAKGKTILDNTSSDPEIEELIFFLNEAGANIQRLHEADGTPTGTIVIDEATRLGGVDYSIPTDRSAVVTYAVAAIATKSREGILVKGAEAEEISTFLSLLDEMGGGYSVEGNGIRFFYKDPLQTPKRTVFSMNKPYLVSKTALGIYADWQPLISILLLQASGTSTLVETAHPDRFHHLRTAQEVGAQISFFDPHAKDMPVPYLFEFTESISPHGVIIQGGHILRPFDLRGDDIRLGAFGVIQGLATQGVSTVEGTHQIERGYHNFVDNLVEVGAKISVQ